MKLIFLFIKFFEKIELMQYNDFTIENYFRKKGCLIGKNNRIYIRSLGSEPFLIKVGNNCTITAGVNLITHDGGCSILRKENPELHVYGNIEIRDNCFIGQNSIILPNVKIGPNSIVGAGSVVTKDVPPNVVVAGVPAKIICSLEEYKQKSIIRAKKYKLEGTIATWKPQLIRYFWG